LKVKSKKTFLLLALGFYVIPTADASLAQ